MSHDLGAPPASVRERRLWWISTISAASSFIFSYIAFVISKEVGPLEAIYSSAQLLLLHVGLEELPTRLGLAGAFFHAARLLAVVAWLATGWALVMEFFGKELQRFWTARRGKHTVICGLSRISQHLIHELRQAGDNVVIIDAGEDAASASRAAESGVHLLPGDPAGKPLLRRAGVRRAHYLFAAMEDDGANIEAVLHATELALEEPARVSPLRAFVHIADPQLRSQLRRHRAFRSPVGKPQVKMFNVFENSARSLLRDFPLDHARIRPNDEKIVQIVIVGFGLMGEAVLTRAAMGGHYANLKRLRAIVIDRHATGKEALFRSRYPHFGEVADAQFLQLDAEEPSAHQKIAELCAVPNTISTVVISFDNPSRALSLGLSLAEALTPYVPIRLRLNDASGLGALVAKSREAETLPRQITMFGSLRDACARNNWIANELDTLAKALHEDYLRRLPEAQRARPENRSARPWEELDDDLIDSNRQQADHIPVKLRAAGCHSAPKGSRDPGKLVTEFGDEEVELLGKMEHRRWMAERFLAGWTLGDKDNERRRSPYLVEWEALSPDIQDYDRDAVRIVPGVLDLIGLEIRQ